MEVDNVILVEAGSLIVSLATILAAVKTGLSGIRRRVAQLERDYRAMPRNYVPRTEVELALKGFEGHTKQTNALVQALVYDGNHRHAIKTVEASAVPDFTQIAIEGHDGRGGLNRWEGRIPYLYLDSRKIGDVPAPLVTVGLGCALDLAEALTLPFALDGRPATLEEIAADFAAVVHTPFGRAAAYYAAFTSCRLSEAAMDELVRKRFAVFLGALRRLFPGFDSFPATVKAGCLDLIYGLGVAGLSPPHYPAFRDAVSRCDWKRAAEECDSDTENKAYAARNEARRQLFLQAAA